MRKRARLKKWKTIASGPTEICRGTWDTGSWIGAVMADEPRGYFQPQQAREVADAFGRNSVEYMFIGKSGAILLGYPSATQDVHLFVKKSLQNGERIVLALREIGFDLDGEMKKSIIEGKDFVQIKTGPFDLDLIFAPDELKVLMKQESEW
jgi:hypothetical protein